jgi:hypothetical protein
MHHYAIASLGLGLIKSVVGFADESFGSTVRHARDTERHGDRNGLGRRQKGCGADGFAHAFGLVSGVGGVTTGEYHEEFLAAITSHGIVAAGGGFQAARSFAEHGIAGEVSVSVIDRLETVEVGHED